MRRALPALAALSLLSTLQGSALAQSVALQGMLGDKALLMVDGGPPRTVAPGQTLQGVKVVSTSGDRAVVEIAGQRQTLRVGEAPASVGGQGPQGSGNKIVMTADERGHFITLGAINGHTANFMVDTGASAVSLSVGDAERMGLNYRGGRPVRMSTANGIAQGWQMTLSNVRIGDVEVYGVEAVITPQPMPYVLLGNSFLNRFQMRRDNSQMTLERRF